MGSAGEDQTRCVSVVSSVARTHMVGLKWPLCVKFDQILAVLNYTYTKFVIINVKIAKSVKIFTVICFFTNCTKLSL